MSHRDSVHMYRDMNDQEMEHLEARAIEALNYSRDHELETGMSRIDPSSYEPPIPTHRRR